MGGNPDDVYGAMLYNCRLRDIASEQILVPGAFFFSENNTIVHFEAPNSLSLISSDPSRVCLCRHKLPHAHFFVYMRHGILEKHSQSLQ